MTTRKPRKGKGVIAMPDKPDAKEVMMPIRIQRKRTKGWRSPPNTICVNRPGRFGNPFRVDVDGTREMCVDRFRRWLDAARIKSLGWTSRAQYVLDNLHKLRGKNLACFCPDDQPCHADILLELANK